MHPKGIKYPTYGIYSKWFTGGTEADYIYDWTIVYFPKFAPSYNDIIPSALDVPNRIRRYRSDSLKYDSQFLMEFSTPSDTKGIGLNVLFAPSDFAQLLKIKQAPIQGFIAEGNSNDDTACSMALYAAVLPPKYSSFASYMMSENKAIVEFLISSGQTC